MDTKFNKTFLLEEVLHTENVISDIIDDHDRWTVHHELIFKHDGKFYKTWYNVGATETQDEGPWEYDDNEIECTEVFPVERTVIVYE